MTRRFLSGGLLLAAACGALSLAGCSTTQTRIADHPEIYQSLGVTDQTLVSRGEIRSGMPQNAVWLAWGAPEQKAAGEMRGRPSETWIYQNYTDAYPYGYGYGFGYPYGVGGFGFGGGFAIRSHHGRRFAFVGDPFYDPFFYSYIPPRIPYPYKTVTFVNGRVVSFQYLVPPYH
jgi:hypothetical protein